MNVSRRWLEGFLRRPLDAQDVSRRLAAAGAAVDAVEPLCTGLGDIVVARVEEVRPHPNADRLRVCAVNDGTGVPKQVVCGAPNVVAGGTFPFARVGATVPVGKDGKPFRLEKAKLRGEVSEGMLCSARELGVGQDHDGLWALATDAAPGTPLLEAIPLADDRIVVDVTPNRPDLLGHKGVARELAASYGVPYRLPAVPGGGADLPAFDRPAGASAMVAGVRVAIEDPAGCARFHAAVIRGVRVGPSPDWLKRPLEAVGVRSISNVVDATNWVMLELGQPMHAYDLARLRGATIVARDARPGERLLTLDGVERALAPGMTVIADAEGPVGVGGVIGGHESEVREATTDLLLECAWFEPSRVRRTRRALGVSTEASYRFERGVDRWNGAEAMRRCIELVLATAGGTLAAPPLDLHPEPAHPPRIFLRLARVAQVLGLELGQHEVERCLVAVGCTVVAKPGDGRLAVDVPGWRPDLQAEIDLVEEVARIHGYDRVPTELRPFRVGARPDDAADAVVTRVRDGLVAEGLSESLALPFGPQDGADAVALLNPLADTGAWLRTRLLPGLVRQAERNWNAQVRDVRLFEVGTVFRAGEAGGRPGEALQAAVVVTGGREPAHWTEARPADVDLWDLKGISERLAALAYPGTAWHVEDGAFVARDAAGRQVGWAGELPADRPPWAGPLFGAEIEVVTSPRPVRPVAPLPSVPASTRDLSLVVPDGLAAADVAGTIRSGGGPSLEAVRITSEFRGAAVGEGRRSVTFRLVFRAPDRTLRDEEVDAAEARILAAVQRAHGLERRGGDA